MVQGRLHLLYRFPWLLCGICWDTFIQDILMEPQACVLIVPSRVGKLVLDVPRTFLRDNWRSTFLSEVLTCVTLCHRLSVKPAVLQVHLTNKSSLWWGGSTLATQATTGWKPFQVIWIALCLIFNPSTSVRLVTFSLPAQLGIRFIS